MLYGAGDGNCLYRAVLVRLMEAAAGSQDSTAVATRLTVLHSELPKWMTTPRIKHGYQLLMVGLLLISLIACLSTHVSACRCTIVLLGPK